MPSSYTSARAVPRNRLYGPSTTSEQCCLTTTTTHCRRRLFKSIIVLFGFGLIVSTITLHQMTPSLHEDTYRHRMMRPWSRPLHSVTVVGEQEKPVRFGRNANETMEHIPNPITIDYLRSHPPFPRPKSPLRWSSDPPHYPNHKLPLRPPVLEGAQRGTIQCDVNVDFLAYWNDPVGLPDRLPPSSSSSSSSSSTPPFRVDTNTNANAKPKKYVTFEFDKGGWNNIRISMENILIFAVATGRTLVLPPDVPIYLLKQTHNGKQQRGFGDFFSLDSTSIHQYGNLEILTTDQYLTEITKPRPLTGYVQQDKYVEAHNRKYGFQNGEEDAMTKSRHACTFREKNANACTPVFRYMRRVGYIINGTTIRKPPGHMNKNFTGDTHCLVWDEEVWETSKRMYEEWKPTLRDMTDGKRRKRAELFCNGRDVVLYTEAMRKADVVHFPANLNEYRLLNHFYTFLHFTDGGLDTRYKRYIRDFLHYRDEIFCAAGKVVLALQAEYRRDNPGEVERGGGGGGGGGGRVDEEGGSGGYSAFHVRRGDFQFKKQKISAKEWYENTKDVLRGDDDGGGGGGVAPKNETLYIATDERDKTFFGDLAEHYNLRYLDDYWDVADLGNVDPNYFGMIDTIVASRGRIFVGTWFSTFTAYINRMRGYNGMSMDQSFYGLEERKTTLQGEGYWPSKDVNYAAREFSMGWVGIDGDGFTGGEEEVERALKEEVVEEQKEKGEDNEKNVKEGGNHAAVVVERKTTLGRGLSGLPMEETPALVGAERGTIECDGLNVDRLAYWNFPQGTRDLGFRSPFAGDQSDEVKYITFQPDRGGWNNVRMHLEIIFIFAVATKRTLVLPPAVPLYLLNKEKSDGGKHRGFADFFPLKAKWFRKGLEIITFEEFFEREVVQKDGKGRFPITDEQKKAIEPGVVACDKRAASDISCDPIFDWLESIGTIPEVNGKPVNGKQCIVFDEDKFNGKNMTAENQARYQSFCEWSEEETFFFGSTIQDEPLIHFASHAKTHRMLGHFYGILLFTNPEFDNYFKRFVRDYMHYHDKIYCAAGKIVLALQKEGQSRGFTLDDELGGGYSSLHVRRGDLQFKKVKISAEDWYANLNDTWLENEILYIATDERNKTFFGPIAERHDIRFLDDYWHTAELGDLDPNYMGMIDTIVASRGRVFAGTFWSTFTGYINRMRGYHGMSMKNSYYGWYPRKYITHTWEEKNNGKSFGYEWPAAWIGIDGDVAPSRDKF